MKKTIILLIICLVLGCNGSVNDCGEIYSKYIKNGEYFLVINLTGAMYSLVGPAVTIALNLLLTFKFSKYSEITID